MGSKSSKLLAYRLKKQHAERTIYKIRDPQDNGIKYDLDGISRSFEIFYKNIYTQPKLNNNEQATSMLGGLDLPKVSDTQNDAVNAAITREELDKAISGLKTNKSAGPDGYTAEWYKVFREPLTPLLLRTFNWVLQGGGDAPLLARSGCNSYPQVWSRWTGMFQLQTCESPKPGL